jgi:hypothetical protein
MQSCRLKKAQWVVTKEVGWNHILEHGSKFFNVRKRKKGPDTMLE